MKKLIKNLKDEGQFNEQKAKSKIKLVASFTAIATVIAIAITQIVYGNNFNKEQITQSGFFTTDKTEIAQNGYVTMTIDLSQIEYDNFKFTLSADSNLKGNVSKYTGDTATSNNIEADADGNTITIVAKKSELSASKIVLYYKVPTSLTIGSTITLTAKIENTATNIETSNTVSENTISKSNETFSETNTVINSTLDKGSDTSTIATIQNYKEATVKLTIVKEESNSNTTNSNNTQQSQAQPNANNMQVIQNTTSTTQTKQITATTTSQMSVATSTKTTATETYKGSYINYLTGITVNGYSITPEFSMTNTTYMVEVENSVTSIDISTTQYDSTSTVKIYGNTDLQVGQNKVLISVTAQNGSVRIYRIYVTRKAA